MQLPNGMFKGGGEYDPYLEVNKINITLSNTKWSESVITFLSGAK